MEVCSSVTGNVDAGVLYIKQAHHHIVITTDRGCRNLMVLATVHELLMNKGLWL